MQLCVKPFRLSLVFLILAVLPVAAAETEAMHYRRCLADANANPSLALNDADGWVKSGGGVPAEHCAALALVNLKRYAEAGSRLDKIASGREKLEVAFRVSLFDQAGNAWLLAGQADKAIASFTAALAVDPLDADLLADRARAHAFNKNWAKAESDLSAALMVSPDRADLYVLRGSARHGMGRKADARADFDRALKLQPNNADALVERGTARLEGGDVAGARADWQKAMTIAPGTAAAESARQHLEDSTPASH